MGSLLGREEQAREDSRCCYHVDTYLGGARKQNQGSETLLVHVLSIRDMMDRGRSLPLEGGRLARIALIERVLQPATSAI